MQFRLSASTQRFATITGPDIDRRLRRAALKATHRAGVGLQQEVRTVMRGARLGNLGNAIKLRTDLRAGTVHLSGSGWSASAFLYPEIKSPRTAGALESYLEGRTITPVNGRWLAIATNEIPRRAADRLRMTPKRYVEGGFESRIGPLTFVPGKHAGVAYLVVKDATINLARQGKARRLPKRGGVRPGRVRVGFVAFVLIRATRRSRRLDVQSIAFKWQSRLPRFLLDELEGRG